MIWIIAAQIVACLELLGFWFEVFQEQREFSRRELKRGAVSP